MSPPIVPQGRNPVPRGRPRRLAPPHREGTGRDPPVDARWARSSRWRSSVRVNRSASRRYWRPTPNARPAPSPSRRSKRGCSTGATSTTCGRRSRRSTASSSMLLAGQVRRLSQRVLEALYDPADRRVVRRLAELAELYDDGAAPIVIGLRQDDLATMAGTTRSTTNRVPPATRRCRRRRITSGPPRGARSRGVAQASALEPAQTASAPSQGRRLPHPEGSSATGGSVVAVVAGGSVVRGRRGRVLIGHHRLRRGRFDGRLRRVRRLRSWRLGDARARSDGPVVTTDCVSATVATSAAAPREPTRSCQARSSTCRVTGASARGRRRVRSSSSRTAATSGPAAAASAGPGLGHGPRVVGM